MAVDTADRGSGRSSSRTASPIFGRGGRKGKPEGKGAADQGGIKGGGAKDDATAMRRTSSLQRLLGGRKWRRSLSLLRVSKRRAKSTT